MGTWTPKNGAVITWNYTEHNAQVSAAIRNKSLKALSVSEQPYVMLKADADSRIGTDKYEVSLQ